jgi:hypothetical protein
VKLCACGPMPVRPLPGHLCKRCERFIVGPPKPNRNLALHQTPKIGGNPRVLNGIVGTTPVSKGVRARRRLTAHMRRQAAQQRQLPLLQRLRVAAVNDGPMRLDALTRRAEAA